MNPTLTSRLGESFFNLIIYCYRKNHFNLVHLQQDKGADTGRVNDIQKSKYRAMKRSELTATALEECGVFKSAWSLTELRTSLGVGVCSQKMTKI